uniref:HMA domain-containing protein n=1 Tax=Aureoumbra lagunensis TaxID=44058 RepID=A0A7S3NK13_9STRA|mmetsp:Transcript_12533/g.16869  ORF Transcript_12533/g.16869 Transcript_12533/m.16869 type:complete len:468 (-) Transcript_12533:867-2270(-)
MKDHSGSSQDESFTYRPRRSPCHSPSAPPTMMLPPGSPSSLWRLSSDNSLASSQLSSATPTLVNTGITNHPLKMTNQPPGQTNYALAAAAAHAAASSLGTEEPVLTDCHAAAAVLEPQDAAQVALLAWAAASAPPVSLQNGFDTTGAAPEKKEDCSLIMPSPHQMERIPSTETQTKSSAAKSLKRPFSGSTNACEQKTNGAPIPPALSVLAETAGLENTKSVVLRVPGMMCLGSCGATIDRALCVLPETRVVGIDVPRRLVHCHTPVNPYEIVKTLNHVGFDSAIVSIAAKSANLSSGSFTEFCDPPENSFEWDIADTLGLISASCDRRCGGNCSCGPSCMCHWCPVHHPERSKSIRTAANTSPHNSISSFTTTSSGSGSSSFRKPCCSARSSQASSSAFPQSKTQSNYKPSGAQFQLPPSQPGALNSRCDDSYFTNSLPPTSIHYSPHCQSNESTSMHQISNAATI